VLTGRNGPTGAHRFAGDETAEVRLRLSFRRPCSLDSCVAHLVLTAVPGVEEERDGAFRRVLRLPGGPAIAALRPRARWVDLDLTGAAPADVPRAVQQCRRLLDLDADPAAIGEVLRADPVLARLWDAEPGARIPGAVDVDEFAVRAVLGQQVSTAAARTHAARVVHAAGEPVDDPAGGLTHRFPTPAAIAAMDPAVLRMPEVRRATIRRLAAGEPAEGLPGIGPWTLAMIAMRGRGEPDAFPATDLGVKVAAERLGLPAGRALVERAERWRPFRSYATAYLWSTLA
jgi:AraC family transcriptional regulator of adaptative response / DNA-3-methyladenine glycosylase II